MLSSFGRNGTRFGPRLDSILRRCSQVGGRGVRPENGRMGYIYVKGFTPMMGIDACTNIKK